MDKENTKLGNNLLGGWKRFFGLAKPEVKVEPKPLPKNRFFKPEELEFLSKAEDASLLERWAVRLGHNAYMSSSGLPSIEYNAVMWSNGLLASWVDGEQIFISDSEQAELLSLLKKEGYVLSDKQEEFVKRQEMADLVGKTFEDRSTYLHVDGVSTSSDPTLTVLSYNKDSMVVSEIPVELKELQTMMGRGEIKPLSESGNQYFSGLLEQKEEYKRLFNEVIKDIHHNGQPRPGGNIRFDYIGASERHDHSPLGSFISDSWKFVSYNHLQLLGYFGDDRMNLQTRDITPDSNYKYIEFLEDIDHSVKQDNLREDIVNMFNALARQTKDGLRLSLNDGSVVSINTLVYSPAMRAELVQKCLSRMDELSLQVSNKENEQARLIALTAFNKFSRVLEHVEGRQESAGKLIFSYQQEKGIDDRRVTNLNGYVTSVRDYLETLKDKDNVLSGDYIDHLPEDRELYTLYDRYEKLEAELDSARFGLPYSKEDRDNLMQQRNEAKSKFEDRLVGILKNFSQDGQVLVKDDKVQGLESYRRWDIETIVHDFFNERFEVVDDAPTPGLIEIYGSRGRGTAHDGSDLDVVVEYEGDWKEDAVFNILHEEPLEIDGINVDINPITKGQTGSMRKFMERSREYDSQVLSGQKPRFSLASTGDMQDLDREYLEAVESGDMEKAQRMVNAAAASKGYSSISSYQGTSAFNGAAPWGNGYFNTPEERKEAWESDSEHLEYEGDQTLADYIENGVNAMSLDYVALDPRFYRATNDERKEAILNVRNVIQSKSVTITMYRSVPSTVKEESFRNGDWITPSKQYAIENAAVHGWGDEYRIIEQEVPTSEIWWDGNDIAEWGYGREEDYVNDRDFAYKNTANNKKLLDAVTYDDEGKVIPLSQRFNENAKDIRYQGVTGDTPLTKEEVELRDTLVGKLRSAGIDVITDEREGQRVLDLFKDDARHQTAYHGTSASFDRFDHSFMGKGEGNQSLGWGTYVSQNEDVSRFYAEMTEKQNSKTKYFFKDKEITWDTPSSMSLMFVFHSIENQEMTAKEAIDKQLGFLEDNYKKGMETGIFLGGKEVLERDIPLLRSAKPEDFRTEKPTVAKNLYTVEIPDDNKENYIDFDAPLTPNQLQVVRSGIKDKPWYKEKDFADMGETTGGKIYDRIASLISPRETSNLLSELGFKGMKAPIGYFLKQADSDKYNYVIFKEDDLKIKDHVRYFKSKEGESYGFTVDGKIYVDPRIATAETPIHEYTHLWATALQKGNPKEWSNVVSLMKDTSVWNEVRENYKDLKTDDEIADEVLATYSGRRGAEKLRQMQADIKNSDAPAARKAGLQKGIYRIIMALDKFWKSVSSFLGTHYESAEQVADRALRDMLHGINPARQLGEFNAKRDLEYLQAVKSGDIGKAYSMVVGQADMMLADNPMPDNTDAYSLRTDSVPGKTIKVYKTFTLDKDGDPTAMYVSGKDKLPMGVWLDAKDSWHFTAANGKQYVPSTKNPNGRGNRTGTSVPIPSDEVRQQLIERGFLPKDSKASSIVALAYRPGWHAADLPYFPQGGKQDPESNYGHVHRHNQVVFECELDAGTDYTDQARNQSKAFTKAGKLNLRDADLQWMPSEGFYQYTTNQFLPDEEKGHWYIGGSMRINRALTQEECDRILAENGKPAQEWQQGHLDLAKLGYVSSMSHVKPILSPVAFYEDGNIVPLSERFKTFTEEMEPKAIAKKIYDPRKEIPSVRGEWTKDKVLSRLKSIGGSLKGTASAARCICEFDSPEELKEHMFYHGTVYGGGNLKPSITMSDKFVERHGGGGYGDKYWGVSLTSDKKIASRFGGIHDSVSILPVILVKGANVKEMPDLQDAKDLNEHITDLWKEGVDAVWIGNKDEVEHELCVLNPKAMVNIDKADFYKAFMLGSDKNPLHVIDDAGIEKLYDDAHDYVRVLDNKPQPPLAPSAFVMENGKLVSDDNGHLLLKDKETYRAEREAYEKEKSKFYSSEEYRDWSSLESNASRKIRFMFIGEKGATSLDLSEKQSMDDVGKRMSLLNLAKSMNQDDKDARLIKSTTGWELGADGDWRYEIPDIKGFDWNGNLNFEREHPDYHRYKELVEKDNRYSWLDGSPLTAEEQAECDKLSKKYASLALKKLDDSHTLDAFIEAPDLFKAYPELKKVEMRFEPLDSDYLAQYSRSRSIYDYMTGGDAKKSIVINTNKLCMVTDQATFKSVLSHEMQHAVQDIEGFAQGGNIGEVRKSVENVIKENQWSSEYAKAKLNEWSRIKLLEINLGRYERLIKSDNSKIRETAAQYYGDALNFISDNPKSELVIDWDRYGDKNFVEMAETGYYVEDAKKELGRLATLTDFEQKIIPEGNMNSLQIVNKMESVLEEQSDDEMYWNLAGEVESRNVQNRMNMTEEQRKNSLASETEDVERKDQLVILSKPTYAGLNLVPKADGRWHTEKNELRDTYAMYGKMIADYLSTFNKDLEVIPWNQQEQVIIDGNGKPYEGVNAIMLGLDYNNRYLRTQLPIYITEEEIEKNGYGKFPSSKSFPIIVDGKTTEVYHVSGLALKAGVVTPGEPDSELKAEYENWKRLNTPLVHSLKAFPIENYPELGVKTKLGAADDNNFGTSNYYREVTHALIETSRSKSKVYTGDGTKGERGREVLIQNLASSVLGRKYGYMETDGPRDRLRLAAHLERDPKFAEDVLKEAAKTSKGVGDFIEDAVQSWGEDKKLDLRSLTPGEVDLDGNGVVDSQENLAPDTKQDESVTQEKTHERSHGFGRGR